MTWSSIKSLSHVILQSSPKRQWNTFKSQANVGAGERPGMVNRLFASVFVRGQPPMRMWNAQWLPSSTPVRWWTLNISLRWSRIKSRQRQNSRGRMMITSEQRAKAWAFLSLHTHGELLILPNVWSPIGARILEHQGYPAVATASASIAESLGYEDRQRIRLETMLEVLFRISRSVSAPVTADIEAGYADTVATLKENILSVMETGVVGVNLEDSLVEGGPLRSEAEQCERIAA